MLLIMKYSFLRLIREFDNYFWCGAFPLILATLFSMSFGSYLVSTEYEPIKAGIVVENEKSGFIDVIDNLNGEYLDVKEINIKEAKDQLSSGSISGYYVVSDNIALKVADASLNASILSEVVSEYNKNEILMEKTISEHPENMEKTIDAIMNFNTKVNDVSLAGKIINVNNQFFYALIAMACLYGNFLGLHAMVNIQANLSPLGARRAITPTHKMKVIFSEFFVNVGVHMVNLMVLLVYLKILGVVLDGNVALMILICIVGVINGVSLGMLIGSVSRKSLNFKTGIALAISMSASFLAGLMFAGMKGVVQTHAPIVNMINPAALISDAFYSLTVFASIGRYSTDLLILCVESFIMLAISFMIVRRARYVSI